MHPAGLAVFENRDDNRSEIYSYEQRKNAKLPPAYEKEFRRHPVAWKFFRAQAPRPAPSIKIFHMTIGRVPDTIPAAS
jgi:hypothetical protein